MSDWPEPDKKFMRAARAEAEVAASVGEIPVGAVVVKNGEVIGAGMNRSIQDADPTAHAEIVAIRAAAQAEQNYRLNSTTIYVTLEPCAMCIGAMIQARISRLVFGAYDEKAGAAGSVLDLADDRRLNHRIEVNGGLQEKECAAALKRFFELRRRQ
ncbi:MAG: tRNA adenosine(34) deaminase TadA [Proteobacteria bacterium]|nr:tRNA adenosine(34) deaminase TadA [Pseudomonadota bacterium]TDJ36677.1 MAG: tRNA adenosine(34) deaminase TadA [Gammaproteobacteria bacterium]